MGKFQDTLVAIGAKLSDNKYLGWNCISSGQMIYFYKMTKQRGMHL